MKKNKQGLLAWIGFIVLLISNLLPARSGAYILGNERGVSLAWQTIQTTGLDKVGHFSLFFIITSLFVITYPRLSRVQLSLFFLIGVALEFSQELVKGRSFEWLDLAANIAGVSLAVFWVKAKVNLKREAIHSQKQQESQ